MKTIYEILAEGYGYEVMFFITDTEKTEATIKSIEKFITDNNGEIHRTTCWKRMYISYTYGDYVLITFTAPEETAKKLKHVLRVNEFLKTNSIYVLYEDSYGGFNYEEL